jgi:hypothetical protein
MEGRPLLNRGARRSPLGIAVCELPGLGRFLSRLDADLSVYVGKGIESSGWAKAWVDRLAERRTSLSETHKVRFDSVGAITLARVSYRLTARAELVAMRHQSSAWSIRWSARSTTNGSPLSSGGRIALSSNAKLREAILAYIEANLSDLQRAAVEQLDANIQERLDQVVSTCMAARGAAETLANSYSSQ